MSTEELKVVLPATTDPEASKPVNETQPTEQESSPEEIKARAAGWKPKEEFTGDEAKWVPAKEFNFRGELFGKISEQNKHVTDLTKSIEQLKQHNINVYEAGYKKAIAELKALKKQAATDGDAAAMLDYDEQLETVRDEFTKQTETIRAIKTPEATNNDVVRAAYQDWIPSNRWYETDKRLQVRANEIGAEYNAQNPGASPQEVFEYAAQEIRAIFPDKFKSNRETPNRVEGNSSREIKPKTGKLVLADFERQIMNNLVRGGHITEAKYIEDLAKQKGLV